MLFTFNVGYFSIICFFILSALALAIRIFTSCDQVFEALPVIVIFTVLSSSSVKLLSLMRAPSSNTMSVFPDSTPSFSSVSVLYSSLASQRYCSNSSKVCSSKSPFVASWVVLPISPNPKAILAIPFLSSLNAHQVV